MIAVCGKDRTDGLRASDCSSIALSSQHCWRGRPVRTPHTWLRAELAPAKNARLCSWLLPHLLPLPLVPLVDQLRPQGPHGLVVDGAHIHHGLLGLLPC